MVELAWQGRFPYTAANVEEYVGRRGGIYMISVRFTDATYRPIYVGQSQDLRARLLKHRSASEKNDCLVENRKFKRVFRYCYVSEANRDDVEYTLYKKYKPECNDVIPSGNLVNITLPYK